MHTIGYHYERKFARNLINWRYIMHQFGCLSFCLWLIAMQCFVEISGSEMWWEIFRIYQSYMKFVTFQVLIPFMYTGMSIQSLSKHSRNMFSLCLTISYYTPRLEQRHFAEHIVKGIFLNENHCFFYSKFTVRQGQIDNKALLVQRGWDGEKKRQAITWIKHDPVPWHI